MNEITIISPDEIEKYKNLGYSYTFCSYIVNFPAIVQTHKNVYLVEKEIPQYIREEMDEDWKRLRRVFIEG